jgi:hypothetical protein
VLPYLSDAWIAAADAATRGDDDLAVATADVALVVEQTVLGGPDGDRTYHVAFDHGTVTVATGHAPRADITLTTDWDTAIAIARGDESAQVAFMAGRLRLGGDARSLLDRSAALAGLADALGPLRADTDFGSGR